MLQAKQKAFGPYKYESEETDELLGGANHELERRAMTYMENGARYIGQWIVGTKTRQGRGVQIWSDGTIYMGYWKDNKACFKGRLIHADCDVYEGDWVDDKAHG